MTTPLKKPYIVRVVESANGWFEIQRAWLLPDGSRYGNWQHSGSNNDRSRALKQARTEDWCATWTHEPRAVLWASSETGSHEDDPEWQREQEQYRVFCAQWKAERGIKVEP